VPPLVTVIDDEADLPPEVAVIVALPAAAPVTSPFPLTVAVPGAEVLQENVAPGMTLLAASYAVAVSCTVFPTAMLALPGVTATRATGGGGALVTVMLAEPLLPPVEAVIAAVPAARPLTTPEPLTVAVFAADVLQVKVRPVRTLPLAS
jgi:hypothetical protein